MTEEVKGIRVCVEYEEICTHSYHDGEQYGHWEQSYDSEVTNAYVLKDGENGSYRSDVFLLPEGTTRVYVVYMIYGTGDSFGHADGKIDIIHCTGNEDKAHELAQYISKHSEQYTIEFTDDFGREISLYNPGAGYFERIDYVEVTSFDIGGYGHKRRYTVN